MQQEFFFSRRFVPHGRGFVALFIFPPPKEKNNHRTQGNEKWEPTQENGLTVPQLGKRIRTLFTTIIYTIFKVLSSYQMCGCIFLFLNVVTFNKLQNYTSGKMTTMNKPLRQILISYFIWIKHTDTLTHIKTFESQFCL